MGDRKNQNIPGRINARRKGSKMYAIFQKIILFIILLAVFVCSPFVQNAGHTEEHGDDRPLSAQPGPTMTGNEDSQGLLSLERCIEIALANNPEIAAAKWDISAADSRLDSARSAFWPQVSAEGNYQRYSDAQRLIAARYNGEPGTFDKNLLRSDLVARLNLFAGGRMVSETSAAGKLSTAEKKKFIRTRDELTYTITSVYFSILGQQKLLDSLDFSRKALENVLCCF